MKIVAVLALLIVSSRLYGQAYEIKATVKGFPDGTSFELRDYETNSTLQTCKIEECRLDFKGELTEFPRIVFIQTRYDNHSYWFSFFLEPGSIKIEGNKNDFPFNLTIKGSKSEDEYRLLRSKTSQLNSTRDSITTTTDLFQLINDTTAAGQKKLQQVSRLLNQIDRVTDSFALVFINEKYNTYAGAFEAYVHRKKIKTDSLDLLYTKMDKSIKESIYGRKLKDFLTVGELAKIGDKYTEITGNDINHQPFKLSGYVGEKYILVEFTEAYCGPCIKALKELKEIQSTFFDNIQIISFSGDRNYDDFMIAAKRDNHTWPYIWKEDKSAREITLLKYGISGYPAFILINKEGKIIDSFSGYGETGELMNKLQRQVKN